MAEKRQVKAKSVENLAKMEEIRGRLNMSKSDFSIALGYVTEGGYDASTKNGANLMQLLAAEGAEMRYAGKSGQPSVCYTLLAVQSDGQMFTLPIGDSPQTAIIMGQEYILVPIEKLV